MKKTKMFYKLYLILLMVFTGLCSVSAQQDVAGSKDHPVISRYPGSYIGYYETQDFKDYNIATGPQTGYKEISDWLPVKGKLTRIYYELPGTVTLTQVYDNYLNAMKRDGFEILASGNHSSRNVSSEIGGGTWLKTFYEKNPVPEKNILINAGSATSGGTFYLAGKSGKGMYITVGGSEYSADKKVFIVDIIEETIVDNNLIVINAAEMLRSLKAEGKIALYGILFDVNKADIKPESAPALKEIASLLSSNPELNLYIVGHTDMDGTLEHNMELSQRRAESVVSELVNKYNISKERLSPKGTGPLAPVSTNETAEGKALNRRVELVVRNN